ncbi:MAG: PepSY domain-containing protein, partial [Xanthomonadales bacterium]|nr:PepSY domain-containing protein [Xanthomonadales bacterium]
MRWLRWAHRYFGAVIAALMLVLAVTGGALIFKDEIWRLRYPSLSESLPPLGMGEHAAAFRAIEARYGQRLRMVRLPR